MLYSRVFPGADPLMQRGNLVLFMVLSLGILLGWLYLQNQIWPRKEKEEPKAAEVKKDKPKVDEKAQQKAREQAWSNLPLLGRANLLAASVLPGDTFPNLVWLHPTAFKDPLEWTRQGQRLGAMAFALAPPALGPVPFANLRYLDTFTFPPITEAVTETKKGPKKTVPKEPELTVLIGGDDFFLQAKLTTRGAGVQALWLNKFRAADYLGNPVRGEEGSRLELIGEDPIVPSFLMYHYEDPAKEAKNNPVTTLGTMTWKLESKEPVESLDNDGNKVQEVIFSTRFEDSKYDGWSIRKKYRLEAKAYHLGLTLEITNDGADEKAFRYQLMGSHGMPVEGQWYTGTHRDAIIGLVNAQGGVDRNRQDAVSISNKEGGSAFPEQVMPEGFSLMYAGTATQYFASVIGVDKNQSNAGSILHWARPTKESWEVRARYLEIVEDHLWVMEADSKEPVKYHLLPRTKYHIQEKLKLKENSKVVVSYYTAPDKTKVATWIRYGDSPRAFFDDITVRVNSSEIKLKPKASDSHKFTLYHGPVKVRLLDQFTGEKAVPQTYIQRYVDDLHLYTLTDYHTDNFFGRISRSIGFTWLLIAVTTLMHKLLYWFSFVVGNYGLAIILLTVVVRGMMFPISRKQALFSIKMQQLAPELKKVQEKYKNDPRAKTQATMEFYRKHGVNPLASCLPLIMQLPIFLGLYFALQESIHFRLARFLWIDNLAAPDMLLYWSQGIPWISDPDNIGGFIFLGPYLNLLPILAVILMMVQQSMMAPPVMDEQQAMQMKVMKFMMIFIAVLFYKVAAGLAVYFIASSLWGLAERRLLPKKDLTTPDFAMAGKGGPPTKGGGPSSKGGKGSTKKEEETGTFSKFKKWWQDVLKEAKKK